MLPDALLQDVACRPEHAQRGVLALMHGIHRTYGLIRLLYLPLLTQVEHFLDCHSINQITFLQCRADYERSAYLERESLMLSGQFQRQSPLMS